jgi:hypothetical protein
MTAEPVTPTIRAATRRSLFWVIAIAFAVIVALITLIARGAASGGTPFSATNPAPAGSKAIAEVLKQQGVGVTVPSTFRAAESGLRTANPSTLFLVDPDGHLTEARLRSLARLATHIVVLSPTFTQLKVLAPQVAAAGVVKKASLPSGCELRAATNARTVTGTGTGYRLMVPGTDATACFGSGKSVYSLIDVRFGNRSVTVLGTTDALSNEHVSERGNAALALTLLGDSDRLVWYLPTIDDSVSGARSIAQLTPGWVGSVAALLILVAIAAAFWRGRRLGPLVVENLPVVVRASETMEGRARLYQKGGARLHALDSLRIGAIARLGSICGLPRLATVDEVIAAVAAVTGRDASAIRGLLVDAAPGTDRELVRLSDALLDLEKAAARGIRPTQSQPT